MQEDKKSRTKTIDVLIDSRNMLNRLVSDINALFASLEIVQSNDKPTELVLSCDATTKERLIKTLKELD